MCGCAKHAEDGGVIPDTGFPQDGGTAKEGHRKDDSITVQNSSISFNTCIRSTAVVLGGYTFEACVFGADRVRYDVEEVDVLGSSWEVVVHGSSSDGRWYMFFGEVLGGPCSRTRRIRRGT